MNALKIMIMLFPLYAFLSQCSDSSTEPPVEYGKVKLIAETTAASFVRLKLEITSEQTYDAFMVERNGNTVKESDITGTDTVFYDGGLEPQSAYNYKAYLLKNGRQIDTSATLTVTTTAATSHDFTWRVDTLGDYGSILRDVSVVSPTDVWAVGEVIFDPLGDRKRYTAVHWDGNDFEYHLVDFINYHGGLGNPDIETVHAFSANDIWVFAYIGAYARFDGSNWTTEFIELGQINDVWGISSSDFYCVGNNGIIAHYNGVEFTKIESGTTEDLYDIKGIVDPESGQLRLWVAGLRTLLYYNGQNWRIIVSRNNPFYSNNYINPRALFIPDTKNLIVSCFGGSVGSMLYLIDQQNYKNFRPLQGHEYFAYGMDGASVNDILIAGGYNGVEYYNGASIVNYPTLLGPGDLLGIGYNTDHAFMVGISGPSDYRALFIQGIKQ